MRRLLRHRPWDYQTCFAGILQTFPAVDSEVVKLFEAGKIALRRSVALSGASGRSGFLSVRLLARKLVLLCAHVPVSSTHPDYDANAADWSRARDVLAGEDAVKSAGEKYLPRLDVQTDEEFLAYRKPQPANPDSTSPSR